MINVELAIDYVPGVIAWSGSTDADPLRTLTLRPDGRDATVAAVTAALEALARSGHPTFVRWYTESDRIMPHASYRTALAKNVELVGGRELFVESVDKIWTHAYAFKLPIERSHTEYFVDRRRTVVIAGREGRLSPRAAGRQLSGFAAGLSQSALQQIVTDRPDWLLLQLDQDDPVAGSVVQIFGRREEMRRLVSAAAEQSRRLRTSE